jgi:hypothetical protein
MWSKAVYKADKLRSEPVRLPNRLLKRQDSGDRMSGENKKEEFRKYLERSGVIDSLTKVLVALYEEPEKPANALDFIKQYLGAPTRSLLLLLSTTFCPLLPTIGGVQSRSPLSLLPLLQLPSLLGKNLHMAFIALLVAPDLVFVYWCCGATDSQAMPRRSGDVETMKAEKDELIKKNEEISKQLEVHFLLTFILPKRGQPQRLQSQHTNTFPPRPNVCTSPPPNKHSQVRAMSIAWLLPTIGCALQFRYNQNACTHKPSQLAQEVTAKLEGMNAGAE